MQPAGHDTWRLLETPFFVRDVSLFDVVRAAPDGGVLWAGERESWGGHQTLRVHPRADTGTTTCAQVPAEFAALGLAGEELEEYDLVALDVPPGVALRPVRDLLVAGREQGRWWYEEAPASVPTGRADVDGGRSQRGWRSTPCAASTCATKACCLVSRPGPVHGASVRGRVGQGRA